MHKQTFSSCGTRMAASVAAGRTEITPSLRKRRPFPRVPATFNKSLKFRLRHLPQQEIPEDVYPLGAAQLLRIYEVGIDPRPFQVWQDRNQVAVLRHHELR